jgi:ATP-dependent DNA helicase PIF1
LEGEPVNYVVNMRTEAEGGTLDGWVQKAGKKTVHAEPLFAGWSEKDAPYEPTVTLKVGAQVMLTVNLDQEAGRINGSRGVITEFVDGIPCVQFVGCNYSVKIRRHTWKMEDGTIREQIPLKLAYALTIHKAQGASLDSAFVDIGSSTFEYGQAYVALSRVRSLEALFVYDVDPAAFKVNPIVKEFYES